MTVCAVRRVSDNRMVSDWAAKRPSGPLAGTRTYRYGRDAYVVELVIGSRVTWRDYSVGEEKEKKNHSHILGKRKRGSE